MGGNGKTMEMLKKRIAEAKASAKADSGDILDPLHKLVGGKPGTRWFERGTAEEQALAKKKAEEEKKIAEASKKTAALEQKKIDNGEKKKTPEELEASQVKEFLSKAFKSEYLGNQMTAKEEADAKRAWEKIKSIPVQGFMNPAMFDWGNDKDGKEIKKTVSDYSKAEQGLHNKIRDAYVVKPPTDNTVTLEQFIKESIKNGSLKL
jgi:hypothetical protein